MLLIGNDPRGGNYACATLYRMSDTLGRGNVDASVF